MARILAISSQVVSGYVGLSAITPVMQRLGHEVLSLPTILLSNHPGQMPASGTRIDTIILDGILDTLLANGRLDGLDAILTGYLPSAEHVAFAARAIAVCRSRNRNVVVLCDPVLGDDPKGLYIAIEAAAAIREHLVPLADILTPNRFELSWLTGQSVDTEQQAIAAARSLQRPLVVATSISASTDQLATLAITQTGVVQGVAQYDVAHAYVTKRAHAPNGTGDTLAAVFLSGYLAKNATPAHVLMQAVTAVEALLSASAGHADLQILSDAISSTSCKLEK